MNKVFLTKTWGFDPEYYPALGFSNVSARTKFLSESSPGDWVVIVGTKGNETSQEHRGRLLGMVQVGTDEVDVEAILKETGKEIPKEHYDADGHYRWRFGLPMLEARAFIGFPDLSEVVGSYLPGQVWAAYARDLRAELGQNIIDEILELPTSTVDIPNAREITKQRERANALSLGRGHTGPGPSKNRAGSTIEEKISYSYIFELTGTKKPIYKVGYTSNLEQRVNELNRYLVSDLTGLKWKQYRSYSFRSQKLAYNFEQRVHKSLKRYLVAGETEIYVSKGGTLSQEFSNVFMAADWAVD
ncbi:GIY-YIG nuclease family protein [Vibrio scophthalmi]|uniref:GIY-YIG nuclease family protein n=1 Tax=Vibrio scophthalmi TaxID=45658 RepID=UPI003EB8E22E